MTFVSHTKVDRGYYDTWVHWGPGQLSKSCRDQFLSTSVIHYGRTLFVGKHTLRNVTLWLNNVLISLPIECTSLVAISERSRLAGSYPMWLKQETPKNQMWLGGNVKLETRNKTQSVKLQKDTRKEWEAKAPVGAKGFKDQKYKWVIMLVSMQSSERHKHKESSLISQDQLGRVMHCSIWHC